MIQLLFVMASWSTPVSLSEKAQIELQAPAGRNVQEPLPSVITLQESAPEVLEAPFSWMLSLGVENFQPHGQAAPLENLNLDLSKAKSNLVSSIAFGVERDFGLQNFELGLQVAGRWGFAQSEVALQTPTGMEIAGRLVTTRTAFEPMLSISRIGPSWLHSLRFGLGLEVGEQHMNFVTDTSLAQMSLQQPYNGTFIRLEKSLASWRVQVAAFQRHFAKNNSDPSWLDQGLQLGASIVW